MFLDVMISTTMYVLYIISLFVVFVAIKYSYVCALCLV